jgi:2,5-diamino-6-(ribosylamino)-4(3H)-pyrimidinone 5'-phosphate reductase
LSRPYTILFVTETLDGKIARYNSFSVLSCKEDFLLQHKLRSNVDGIMVGANTVVVDNPKLTVRYVVGKSPARIVVDSKLKVKANSRVFALPGRKILITSKNVKDEDLIPYRRRGVLIIKVDEEKGILNLKQAMKELKRINLNKLLVEGGGFLINTLLSQGLIDEVRVTIAPKIFGKGIGMTGSELLYDKLNELDIDLRLESVNVLCGGWVHIVYSVISPKEPLY